MFWSGAGISRASGAPLGDELTMAALETLCLPGTATAISRVYRRFRLADSNGDVKQVPRLELVLDKIWATNPAGVIALLTARLGNLPPTAVHQFFARHLAAGGRHATVNIDDCIGRARQDYRTPRPLHLHGRVGKGTNPEKLGLRLATIAGGLPHDLEIRLYSALRASRALVFVGYSGRDFFDITPFMASLSSEGRRVDGLDVLWVRHQPGRRPTRVGRSSWTEGRAVLAGLENAGAAIAYFVGDTEVLIRELADQWDWSWARDSVPSQTARRSWPVPGTQHRLAASSSLYAAFGLAREIEPLLPRLEAVRDDGRLSACLRASAAELIVVGLRDGGRYAKAGRAAALAARVDTFDPVRARHLRADVAWLRGRYLSAGWHFAHGLILLRAQRRGRRIARAAKPNAITLDFLITALHWVRDVRRVRIVGPLLPNAVASLLWRELIRQSPTTSWDARMAEGYRRLQRELSEAGVNLPIPRRVTEAENDLVSAFAETDSLIGVINTERAALRNSEGRGVVAGHEGASLLRRSHLIGDRPGVLKAALLAGELSPCESRAQIRTWQQVEWTAIRRLIWLAAFLRCQRGAVFRSGRFRPRLERVLRRHE
jgi:hypothetical protein